MPRTVPRRALGAAGAVAALAVSFGAGVATGSAGGAPAAPSGVLDDAADSIAGSALRPVDRAALDAAAVRAMLAAAGDPWGSWAAPSTPPTDAAVVPAVVSAADGRVRAVRSVAAPAGDVPRLVVPSFTRGTGSAVRRALATVPPGGGRGVLLDLRGNGGGRLDEAVETASALLEAGPVVSYTRRDGQVQRLDAVGTGRTDVPVVVLVDGGTASAAEVVAGALQDRGRAVVVGSRTFGKGSVQEPHRLRDGSSLELTVARWSLPGGRSVEGHGLVPDIEVAPGTSPQVAEARALEVLRGLLASAGGRR